MVTVSRKIPPVLLVKLSWYCICLINVPHAVQGFVIPQHGVLYHKSQPILPRPNSLFQATSSSKSDQSSDEDEAPAAPQLAAAAATSPSPPALEEDNSDIDPLKISSTSASVATMISQENKRILIEELGYRRRDVDRLKFDLAPVLVEKRVACPANGVPDEWCRSPSELAQESDMMKRLEQESQYPLKIPLLGISLVLFGKGFGDALITLIKVGMEFPGASLGAEFAGVPVLLIDAFCVFLGASLGWWTWKTMK